MIDKNSTVTILGFTLLEVMVAVSILAIAMVIIMQLFSIGLRVAQIEKDYTEALLFARTKMNEVLVEADIENIDESGSFENGYAWQVLVEPFDRPVPEMHHQLPGMVTSLDIEEEERFSLYHLQVVVSWEGSSGNKKNVTVDSLRLIKKKEYETTS